MNWHQVIEERSYEMHQVVADVLRRDPAKLDLVVAWIERRLSDPDYSPHSKDALSQWLELIRAAADRTHVPSRRAGDPPGASRTDPGCG